MLFMPFMVKKTSNKAPQPTPGDRLYPNERKSPGTAGLGRSAYKPLMKPAFFLLLSLAIFSLGCSRPSTTISDVDASLTRQFKQQWQEKKEALDKRVIKEAHIGKFYNPSGNQSFCAEIEIVTDDARIITGSPIVPLGGSSFGVSFEMPQTKQNLNAIISLHR